MHLSVINRTGYETASLRRFFRRGLAALAPRRRGRLVIVVVTAPERSRGCATVGGERMVMAISPPSRFRLRRFARLFEHELAHHLGLDHERMSERLLYSLGETPRWAKGSRIVYEGRAPRQSAIVRSGR